MWVILLHSFPGSIFFLEVQNAGFWEVGAKNLCWKIYVLFPSLRSTAPNLWAWRFQHPNFPGFGLQIFKQAAGCRFSPPNWGVNLAHPQFLRLGGLQEDFKASGPWRVAGESSRPRFSGWPRFGLVTELTVRAWCGSSGSGPRVHCPGGEAQGRTCFDRWAQFQFGLQFLKTVPTALVLLSVPGKTVPTVPRFQFWFQVIGSPRKALYLMKDPNLHDLHCKFTFWGSQKWKLCTCFTNMHARMRTNQDSLVLYSSKDRMFWKLHAGSKTAYAPSKSLIFKI